MSERLPRKLKNAMKKHFEASLNAEQMKNRKRIVSFLYKEVLNYEMNRMLEESGIATGSEKTASALELDRPSNSLELRYVGDGFDFAQN